MAKKLLDGPDIVASFEQVGREGVTEGVAGDSLCDAHRASGVVDGALNRAFVKVVAMLVAGESVAVCARRGEDELPAPFQWRGWILPDECRRQHSPTIATREIALVKSLHPGEVIAKRLNEQARQNGHAILPPFSGADQQLAAIEVEILDAQMQRLEQAESGSVEESADKVVGVGQCGQQPVDLVGGQDFGKVTARPGGRDAVNGPHRRAEDVAIEERDRGSRLILGRRAHLRVDRER